MDKEKILSARPVEKLFEKLLTQNMLNILVDEACSEGTFENLLTALRLYISRNDCDVRLFVMSDPKTDDKVLEMSYSMDLDDYVEILDGVTDGEMLTYIMSCSMMITDDKDSDLITLAKKFYLPRVLTMEGASLLFDQGVLRISQDPVDICSAFMLVKDKKHRDEMSGHRRLA